MYTIQVWAVHVPDAPIAECVDWDTGETLARTLLTWATGGPYPHDYHPRTAGAACDRCWSCGQCPAAGARVWMNCYGDLYCDPCARRQDAAWRGQRHPFERPQNGDTYCGKCGAERDGEQHQ